MQKKVHGPMANCTKNAELLNCKTFFNCKIVKLCAVMIGHYMAHIIE